jgi:hypothetical protein
MDSEEAIKMVPKTYPHSEIANDVSLIVCYFQASGIENLDERHVKFLISTLGTVYLSGKIKGLESASKTVTSKEE